MPFPPLFALRPQRGVVDTIRLGNSVNEGVVDTRLCLLAGLFTRARRYCTSTSSNQSYASPHPTSQLSQPRRAGLANANVVYATALTLTVIAQYSTVPNPNQKEKKQNSMLNFLCHATPTQFRKTLENSTTPFHLLYCKTVKSSFAPSRPVRPPCPFLCLCRPFLFFFATSERFCATAAPAPYVFPVLQASQH